MYCVNRLCVYRCFIRVGTVVHVLHVSSSFPPPRRNCPVCGVRSKTLPKRLIVNRTLDAVLRHVRPNDFDGRASALDSTYDVLLHALLQLARAKADFYADDLPGWYLSQYEAVVQRHMEGATTCRCGLFCVPKGKLGTNRLYYGCPRWKPAQNKDVPPVHCGFLAMAVRGRESNGGEGIKTRVAQPEGTHIHAKVSCSRNFLFTIGRELAFCIRKYTSH